MSFAAERESLAAPLVAAWDFETTPVAWPGMDFTPPDRTGDRSNPATWVEWIPDWSGSDYHDFGGGRFIQGVIECRVYVEPVAGGDFQHRTLIDALESAYTGQDTSALIFRVQEAMPSALITQHDWLRQDWILPFWRDE